MIHPPEWESTLQLLRYRPLRHDGLIVPQSLTLSGRRPHIAYNVLLWQGAGAVAVDARTAAVGARGLRQRLPVRLVPLNSQTLVALNTMDSCFYRF